MRTRRSKKETEIQLKERHRCGDALLIVNTGRVDKKFVI